MNTTIPAEEYSEASDGRRMEIEYAADPEGGPAEQLAQLDRLLKRIVGQGGFLSRPDLIFLSSLDRLRPVLVRCGGGRFTCPAQDADHFMAIIDAGSWDYVRDVSLPTSDPIYL